MARALGTGGGAGLGSIIYAFCLIAKCLGDPTLLSDACLAAELFDDDLIASDGRLDVLNGNAGAILSLLRLYEETGSDAVLKRAIRCGDNVVRHFADSGLVRCKAPKNSNYIVFSGPAGMAYSLAVLGAKSKLQEFQRVASNILMAQARIEGRLRARCAGETNTRSCQVAMSGALFRLGVLRLSTTAARHLRRNISSALDFVERESDEIFLILYMGVPSAQ